MNKQIHLVISGCVQGVFFRVSTKTQADALGINGWVRNLPGGQVELMAEGDQEGLNKLVAWCHQGPMGAHVDEVKAMPLQTHIKQTGFSIR